MKNLMTKKKRSKLTVGQVISHVIIICLLIMVLYPFYILIINSFKSPADILRNPLSFPGEGGAKVVMGAFKVAWPYISKYIVNTGYHHKRKEYHKESILALELKSRESVSCKAGEEKNAEDLEKRYPECIYNVL